MAKKRKKADTDLAHWPYPDAAVRLFQMAWQLENWLRTMVYVELRAARLDWEEPIKVIAKEWPPHPQTKDKKLNHMATHHQGALSYLTLGELWDVISKNGRWPLFAAYFPPEANTATKIDEVKTIRNRVAHFRDPHRNDEARFKLFLLDMEAGIRRFCNRYTSGVVVKNDSVTEQLENSWERIGYGYELYRPDRMWLYAPGPHRMQPQMHANLEILVHSRHKAGSAEGVIYKLEISPRLTGKLNVPDFLTSTRRLHPEVVHILVKSDNEVAVTIPAMHGAEKVAELLGAFLSAGINCSRSSFVPDHEGLRAEWPEYILWPDHLLSFYDKEMKGSLLALPAE